MSIFDKIRQRREERAKAKAPVYEQDNKETKKEEFDKDYKRIDEELDYKNKILASDLNAKNLLENHLLPDGVEEPYEIDAQTGKATITVKCPTPQDVINNFLDCFGIIRIDDEIELSPANNEQQTKLEKLLQKEKEYKTTKQEAISKLSKDPKFAQAIKTKYSKMLQKVKGAIKNQEKRIIEISKKNEILRKHGILYEMDRRYEPDWTMFGFRIDDVNEKGITMHFCTINCVPDEEEFIAFTDPKIAKFQSEDYLAGQRYNTKIQKLNKADYEKFDKEIGKKRIIKSAKKQKQTKTNQKQRY